MIRSILLCIVACLIGVASAHADEHIGVVDVIAILNNSDAGKGIQAERETLRSKFLEDISKTEQALRAEEKELIALQGDLSPEDYVKKRQAYEAKLFETRKEAQGKKRVLEEASARALDQLRSKLYEVVESIASERGFSLVISNQNVITGQASLDITEETMERINKTLPAVPLEIEEE